MNDSSKRPWWSVRLTSVLALLSASAVAVLGCDLGAALHLSRR